LSAVELPGNAIRLADIDKCHDESCTPGCKRKRFVCTCTSKVKETAKTAPHALLHVLVHTHLPKRIRIKLNHEKSDEKGDECVFYDREQKGDWYVLATGRLYLYRFCGAMREEATRK